MTNGMVSALEDPDASAESPVYGIGGWNTDGGAVLFYDRADLWNYTFAGAQLKRLTDGSTSGKVYRLAAPGSSTGQEQNFDASFARAVERKSDLLLSVDGDLQSGYSALRADNTISNLLYGKFRVRDILCAKESRRFAYTTQRYDRPPDIRLTGNDRGSKVIFQSNPFYTQFLWGKAERIVFSNDEGARCFGILYYPAGYDPLKKYPMVVHIYENQSDQLYAYRNPTLYAGDGFNVSNFTTNGYLVLLPDIDYRNGDPGISAASSVVAAVRHVIAMGAADPAKIGLMGHSFGGYETNFILTQTNLFAAAISGAGISDPRSCYLSAGLFGVAEFWRFERQQWRMGKSLFEDAQGYERNSPISHAEKIITPLLLWTGDKDPVINYRQSVALYLALKRLGKRPMLLVYPGEGHGPQMPRFQKDLTLRILDWFDYYLKEKPCSKWIADGIK